MKHFVFFTYKVYVVACRDSCYVCEYKFVNNVLYDVQVIEALGTKLSVPWLTEVLGSKSILQSNKKSISAEVRRSIFTYTMSKFSLSQYFGKV